ncbi:hypothetical protein BHM03_00027204 [Ensete ventricosum]|nr:hypothetical protein BHM03_00027204 [Ensete ventricosum]
MGLGSEFGEEEEADGEEASHANAAPTAVIAVIRRTLAHSKSGSQEATISRLRATGVDTKGNLDLGASPAMDEKVRGRPGRRVCDAMELKDARQVEEREEGEGEEPSARREDEVRSCRLTVRKEANRGRQQCQQMRDEAVGSGRGSGSTDDREISCSSTIAVAVWAIALLRQEKQGSHH